MKVESSKNHIIKYLESLKANFPDIQVRYAFEDKTHYHVVEIEPEETFTSIEFTSNLLSFWEDFTENLYFLFDIEKLAHWRASDGGGYYYINEEMKVMCSIDDGTLTDETRYKVGNYFRAKFEAEKVCDQIKKILDTEHGDEKTYEFNGGL